MNRDPRPYQHTSGGYCVHLNEPPGEARFEIRDGALERPEGVTLPIDGQVALGHGLVSPDKDHLRFRLTRSTG